VASPEEPEFTMPPTDVTGAKIATLNDTCGNLIQVIPVDALVGRTFSKIFPGGVGHESPHRRER
jgi:hypothetical protein